MARTIEKRYQKVDLTGKIPTVDEYTPVHVVVWTNYPLRLISDMESKGLTGLADFLSKIIVEWDGFDMELSRESLMELTSEEVLALTRHVTEATRNPQNPMSSDS